MTKQRVLCQLLLASLCLMGLRPPVTTAAEECASFPETGHQVCGVFLAYWRANGGLPVFGFPIGPAQPESAADDGKVYLTQWFERNRFEHHPEHAGTRYEVLLGRLGVDLRREATAVDPDFQRAARIYNTAFGNDEQAYFEETGHNLRFGFLTYWQRNGGLELLGYPISEEHPEYDEGTGRAYVTQWFERARMEYHPENAEPYGILLGLLGNESKKPRPGAAFAWKLGGDFNGLQNPQGIAVDGAGNVYVADTERHRIQKYDRDGTLITRWGSQGGGPGEFVAPRGIAAGPDNSLFVVDSGNSRIQHFDSQGNFLNQWGGEGKGNGQFSKPVAITADAAGRVYVTEYVASEYGGGRIQIFSASGQYLSQINESEQDFARIGGIAVDRAGNVYITQWARTQKFDASGRFVREMTGCECGIAVDALGNPYLAARDRVIKLSPDGAKLAEWGKGGMGPGEFDAAIGIAVDSAGRIYVADSGNNRVQALGQDGTFQRQWGGQSRHAPGSFVAPEAVAVDQGGNVYVAEFGGGRVQQFDPAGRFVAQWSVLIGGDPIQQPTGIAIDRQGNLYITEMPSGKSRVRKFDRGGRVIWQIGDTIGSGKPSHFVFPRGIAVAANGTVYVADTLNGRVQFFANDSRYLGEWATAATDIALDGRGNVVVYGGSQVSTFDAGGRLVAQWGAPSACARCGLAVDGAGNVYLVDASNYRVQQYGPDGLLLSQWGGRGWGDGEFEAPAGIAVDGAGHAFVVDAANNRVQKFQLR